MATVHGVPVVHSRLNTNYWLSPMLHVWPGIAAAGSNGSKVSLEVTHPCVQ